MRTQGVFQQDTAFTDGNVYVPITAAMDALGVATTAVTGGVRNVLVAAGTANFYIDLTAQMMMRLGINDYASEQFGGASGAAANFQNSPPATFTTPWSASGNPPFTGSSQLVPPTSRPKGFSILSMDFVYQTLGIAATANTIGLNKIQFVDNTVPISTVVIAQGANGLTTAVQSTGPSVTNVLIPGASFLTTPDTRNTLTWNITATTATHIYGIWLNCAFNYN